MKDSNSGTSKSPSGTEVRSDEAFYLSLFNDAMIGMAITDPETNSWMEVNEQFCDMFGYNRKEILKMTWEQITHPEDLSLDLEYFEEILDGKIDSYSLEKRFVRKDGSILWGHLAIRCKRNADGSLRHIVALINDLTGRKEAESALKASERRLRAFFEQFNDAIIIHHQGRIKDVNQRVSEMTGYGRDQLLNMSVLDLHREEDREEVINNYSKKALLHEPIFLETQWKQASGTLIDVAINAILLDSEEGIQMGVARDITEQKRASEALAREKSLLDKLFENDQIAILLGDKDHRFVRVNRAFTRLFGYTTEDVIGKSIIEVIVPHGFRKKLPVMIEQEIGSGVRPQNEGPRLRKDGSLVDVLATLCPFSLNNEFGGAFCLFQDISDRKEAERGRAALIEELEARNAELERFTYTVSHDLKSPLITIKAFLGFIEKDAASGNVERMRTDIKRVEDAARKMEQLLSELLELSRIGRIINAPEQVPFEDIAMEAVESVSGRIKERGARIKIHEGLPTVFVDRVRLREVMENLLDNAVRFMGDQVAPRIDIEAKVQGSETVFIVRDNGSGIRPEYQDRVFALFERLDKSVEGTGIGLALVKRIIEVHGGRVWIESAGKGRGTTVCFTLPMEMGEV